MATFAHYICWPFRLCNTLELLGLGSMRHVTSYFLGGPIPAMLFRLSSPCSSFASFVCRIAKSEIHDSFLSTPSTLVHAYVVGTARCETNAIESRVTNAFTSIYAGFNFSRPHSTL